MRRILIFYSVLLPVILSSCNPYQQNSYNQHYVVESYLVANKNLPPVKVSKTLPVGKVYSFQDAALNNAAVSIQLLDSTGSPEEIYRYHLKSNGNYIPRKPEPVLPKHRYKLIVSFPNGDSVTSKTYIPGSFHRVGSVPDSVIYEAPQAVAVHITPSYYPGRQTYFIFTVNAMDTAATNLTPFYADVVSKNDNKPSDYYINSSGIINQKNYTENANGTLTIKLPWLSIAFYGRNKIVANAIDDNLYDFVRTASVQTGGANLPPGQIQNVTYHLKGGIGIFGSMNSDTISVYIKKEENRTGSMFTF
jgi:hypothetical protein